MAASYRINVALNLDWLPRAKLFGAPKKEPNSHFRNTINNRSVIAVRDNIPGEGVTDMNMRKVPWGLPYWRC